MIKSPGPTLTRGMGAAQTLRWADNFVATGEAAGLSLRCGQEIAGRSFVVADPGWGAFEGIVQVLDSCAVDVVTARDACGSRLQDVGHVVVDLTGRDPATALDLVRRALDLQSAGRFDGELQAVAAEAGVGQVRPVHDIDADPGVTTGRGPCDGDGEPSWCVWLPVLSEGCAADLACLHRQVGPDEVCPILPFPARDPRRADDLLLELRDLLIDRLHVDLSRVVYAHESDPFDLYRTLATFVRRSSSARLVVSPTEPGCLALGAFLASYEFGFPFVWRVHDEGRQRHAGSRGLTCAWLAGEPYAPLAVEATP